MDVISTVAVIFAMLGALDRIFGGRLGLAKEFERGFHLLGSMVLTMVGIIVLTPYIEHIMEPCLDFIYKNLHLDPSIIPASIFSNDAGGAILSLEVANDPKMGAFNGFIVSSMIGVTITYTIPYALGVLKKEMHREFLLGILCGIVTIPIGCFVSGLFLGINILVLLYDLLPIIIIAVLVVLGLIFIPEVALKIFNGIGIAIKIILTIGLALGILENLIGYTPIKGLTTFGEAAEVCINAAIFAAGAFPFIYILSKMLDKPLKKIGGKIGVNELSAIGFVTSLASATPMFEMMNDMDKKGAFLNSAFATSGGFTFAAHLAFTMSLDASYVPSMLIGKMTAAFLALGLAFIMYPRLYKNA